MEKYLKRTNKNKFMEIERANTLKTNDNTIKKNKITENLDDKNVTIEQGLHKKNDPNQQINKWLKRDSVILCDFKTTPSDKILGFDMDDTLITVKSAKSKHAVDVDDWILLFDKNKMIEKFNAYINDGYKIAIFTNQKGISLGKVKESEITKKIENIQMTLGIPFIALIATEDDYYRKPSIGLWKLLFDEFNSDIKIPDLKKCLYVGDAAGRKINKKGKKDHSDADYLFAMNLKIDFKTPEAFFENAKNDHGKIEFDPNELKLNEKSFDLKKILDILPVKKDIIIFCGSPGSGKTNLYHSYLKPLGYEHVNQDQLKTEQKCVKVATEYLSQGKGVCIDSTNPSKVKRKVFIDLARRMGATIRCFYFKMDKDLVFHLNNLRQINKFRTKYTKSVADVIIHTWFKNLQEPSNNEGFNDVNEILFIPGPFQNEEDEEIFYCYS